VNPPDQIRGCPSAVNASYVDSRGRLFREDDGMIRHIFAEHVVFYRDLFEKGVIGRLSDKGLLIESHIAKNRSGEGLFITHPRIEPISYPFEWSPAMLKTAALHTIDLAMELAEYDLTLQDATPYNIVFDCFRPVFVDFTSISPVKGDFLWKPYEQFLRLFYLPLLLYSLGAYRFSKMALYNYYTGIEYSDVRQLLPLKTRLRDFLTLDLPYYLERVYPGIQKLPLSAYMDGNMRKRFFLKLREKVERIEIKDGTDTWSAYYDKTDISEKRRVTQQVLGTVKPVRVLDIGANTGQLSFLAAEEGALVVAADSSWECTDMIFREAVKRKARILPLCMDVLVPTPSFGWNLCQYDDFFSRFRADFVIMGAILHHLVLNQWQNFDRVADFADKITERYLLIEFVEGEDEMCRKIAPAVPATYTRQKCILAFEKYFRIVSEHPLTPTRRFCLCEKL
jgi:hypothetical protein